MTNTIPDQQHSAAVCLCQVAALFSGSTSEGGYNADIVTYNEVDGRWTTWPAVLSSPRIQEAAFTSNIDIYNCK